MKKILLFGDSLFNGFRNHQNTEIVTRGIQKRLGNNIQVDNLSKSGATTVEGLDYLAQIQPIYDLILIEYGTNDASIWGITPQNYQRNLEKMIKYCETIKIIITSPWKPCPGSAQVDNFIEEYLLKDHQIAQNLAQKYSLPFIDLWQILKKVTDVDKLYQADGLHLTKLGNQLLIDLLVEHIKKELA